MDYTISVVIPSALKRAPSGELWLSRALRSVAAQTLRPNHVIVGLDPSTALPADFHVPEELVNQIRAVNGQQPGHQAACNAAAAAAPSSYNSLIAFFEDDDEYTPNHLQIMLDAMTARNVGFVSASQQCIHPDGSPHPMGLFHFPTCSSWLMMAQTWYQVGGFDVRFKVHHDNCFLGELNKHGPRRLHLVPDDSDPSHPWLQTLSRFSPIASVTGLTEPTVRRTIHSESIMAGVGQGGDRQQRSVKEYAALEVLYGCIPW